MKQLEISHNDIGEIERGAWRKYNPYNPYVPESEEKEKVDNLKVESLDDLFDDITADDKKEETNKKDTDKKEEQPKPQKNNTSVSDPNEAPILPSEPVIDDDEDDMYDLQKELEAKFDELFGPLDDEN